MLEVFYEKSEKKNGQKHHSCNLLIISLFLRVTPGEIQMSANLGMPVDSIVINDNITPNDQKHKPIQQNEGDHRGPNPQILRNDLLRFVLVNDPTPI